ncbi:MAG: hypothetical protein HKO77_07260, partial [Gemmatimonadetes bacterium]|nr:hypothetical protein [Gemmatimonadota bacterium]
MPSSSRRRLASLGFITAVVVLAGGTTVHAQQGGEHADVTFSRDIAPVFQRSCVHCHRSGGVAPFSLETYEDARPMALR